MSSWPWNTTHLFRDYFTSHERRIQESCHEPIFISCFISYFRNFFHIAHMLEHQGVLVRQRMGSLVSTDGVLKGVSATVRKSSRPSKKNSLPWNLLKHLLPPEPSAVDLHFLLFQIFFPFSEAFDAAAVFIFCVFCPPKNHCKNNMDLLEPAEVYYPYKLHQNEQFALWKNGWFGKIRIFFLGFTLCFLCKLFFVSWGGYEWKKWTGKTTKCWIRTAGFINLNLAAA